MLRPVQVMNKMGCQRSVLLISLSLALSATNAYARAGTLLKCEGISTSQGYKYVGTYCVDYACTFVVRKMFDEYCPYLLDDGNK